MTEDELIDEEIKRGMSVNDLTNKVFWDKTPGASWFPPAAVVSGTRATAAGVGAYSREGRDKEGPGRTQELAEAIVELVAEQRHALPARKISDVWPP